MFADSGDGPKLIWALACDAMNASLGTLCWGQNTSLGSDLFFGFQTGKVMFPVGESEIPRLEHANAIYRFTALLLGGIDDGECYMMLAITIDSLQF